METKELVMLSIYILLMAVAVLMKNTELVIFVGFLYIGRVIFLAARPPLIKYEITGKENI